MNSLIMQTDTQMLESSGAAAAVAVAEDTFGMANVSLLNYEGGQQQTPLEHFFEGAEKRLVLYLANEDMKLFPAAVAANSSSDEDGEDSPGHSSDDAEPEPDLRKITKASWEKILEEVNCRVLNIISNEHMDAYLLSESSMFVSKNRVMIKTCGQTTLLCCLQSMLKLVKEAGFSLVEDVFYSHKNLLAPSLQSSPHHSFAAEAQFLNEQFKGAAHQFGQFELDQWYLYTLNNRLNVHGQLNENEHFKFEMIMEKLKPATMANFFRSSHPETVTASEVTRRARIDTILPGMVIDDYLFTPCGYSMNGILGKHYMTIHITPEPEFSFVSFETDVPQENYGQLIKKLINIFQPGKFMVNILAPSVAAVKQRHRKKQRTLVGGGAGAVAKTMDKASVGVGGGGAGGVQLAPNGMASLGSGAEAVHGLNLYEELLCSDVADDFFQADLQMVHYKQCDIIFARYVAEGIS